MMHKNPVGVHLQSLPNIKSGFRVPSLTELTRQSRIEVPKMGDEKLSADRAAETSASFRACVQAARDMQTRRFSRNGSSDIVCNADMRVGEIRQFCKLLGDDIMLCMSQLKLSGRAYHRILELAHTIADLAECKAIQAVHVAEVLQYRPKLMHSTVC